MSLTTLGDIHHITWEKEIEILIKEIIEEKRRKNMSITYIAGVEDKISKYCNYCYAHTPVFIVIEESPYDKIVKICCTHCQKIHKEINI